jgi:hypothetical protein
MSGVMTKFAIVVGVVGLFIVAALFGAGTIAVEGALLAAVFMLVGSAAMAWNMRAFGQGGAKLTEARLEVHTNTGKHLYKWADILDIELKSLRSQSALRRFWAIGQITADQGFVEIRLRRSVRLGLLPGRSGTDILGLPSLVVKTVRLDLEDPEGFVLAARPFLQT